MVLLHLKRFLSRLKQERRRRRRKVQDRYGSITIYKPRKDKSQRRKGKDDAQRTKSLRFLGPNLPEDIWCHIHSLMPMRDSARVAHVSRTFLHAWTRHANLILNRDTLGFTGANGDITRSFTNIVDHILKIHSGNGVKTLELDIFHCHGLDPCYLNNWLQIESEAPNLSTINFEGNLVQLTLGQSWKVRSLNMECSDETNFICYAITKLPYIVPNLETLFLSSYSEMVTTPMVPARFVHLKHLDIYIDGDLSDRYDFFSLVSFLDASPILETFVLGVYQSEMNFDSVFRDATHMRQMHEHKHHSLKDLKIFGFCSAKSMVELTCHILENATNLECVTLDSI